MNSRRMVAALQLLLIFPAILFMGAVVIRQWSPLHLQPAHSAQEIVMWYAGKTWTLWVLLILLPFMVLISGGTILLRSYGETAELRRQGQRTLASSFANRELLLIAVVTLTAAVILAVVALHMGAN